MAPASRGQRNRYVDLLRALSICVVVLGHWTISTITVTDGEVAFVNLLDVEPLTHPLTWVFQVMPVFFLVGGYANAASLASPRRGTVAEWIRRRALRLLRPAVVLITVALLVRVLATLPGGDAELARNATWAAAAPLWFLVVYLGVLLVAPAAAWAHRRWGWGVVVALVGMVAVGDVLRIASGDVGPAALNYAVGWLAAHQVGIVWHDGGLRAGRRGALGLLAGGLAATLLLVVPGPYGVAMVGAAAGADLTNTAPPTLALLSFATAQLGLVLLLNRPATAWVARPRVWAAVVRVNRVIMTVFLWHMGAMVITGLVLAEAGLIPPAEVGSAAWWAWRPVWIALLAVVLAGLVGLLGRFETAASRPSSDASREGRTGTPSPVMVGLGTGTTLLGLAILGVTDTLGLGPVAAGVPVIEVSLVFAGLAALERAGRTA